MTSIRRHPGIRAALTIITLSSFTYQGFSGDPRELQKPSRNAISEQKSAHDETRPMFSYVPLLRQAPLKESGRDILLERLSFHTRNYFAPHNLIELLNETIQKRITGEETLGKPFWAEIRSSAKQAARETIVRNARVDDLLEKLLPEKVGEIFYNALKGKMEEGTLNNPFNEEPTALYVRSTASCGVSMNSWRSN